MPKKFCNHKGCKKLITMKEKYCDEHKIESDLNNKDRYKRYQHYRNDEWEQNFYASKSWAITREDVRSRDNGVCLLCEDYMDTVHHIIELKEDRELALSKSNLISLCQSCHIKVHNVYRKGGESKRLLQETQRRLINKD